MDVTLTWTTEAGPGDWTGPLPVVLGREGDVVIDDDQVSRRHANLEERDGALVLTDLKSANGTFVGGERVEEARLTSGGTFRLGRVEVVATLPTPAAPETVVASEETVLAEEPDPDLTVRAVESAPVETEPVLPEPPHLVVSWTHTETGAMGNARVASPAVIGSSEGADLRLPDRRVSRRHASAELVPEAEGFAIQVADLDSSNGLFHNGQRVPSATLGEAGTVEVGPYRLKISLEGVAAEPEGVSEREVEEAPATEVAPPATPPPSHVPEEEASILLDEEPEPVVVARNFPPALFDAPVVPVDALRADGRPIQEATYVAVGGGLGSFVWVDTLRVYGIPEADILVLGLEDKPHSRYERLCVHSQIPYHERLRSDSGSCPDCLWGWPGYAVREAWQGFTGRGNFSEAVRATWKIFNEPTFATTYTPRSGVVFDSIDKEASRIGWDRMRQPARVRAIRKTDDGRYAIAYTVPTDAPDRERYAIARFAHVAVGYPGIRLLPDLQTYREETGDTRRVVNAYEEHEHVYRQLAKGGGTVVLRGWGIVASRIIQTLWELRRDKGVNVQVLHLTRRVVAEGHSYRGSKREVDNNWEFQPFNWPKACWGGDLRFDLESAGPEKRAELLKAWGGTTTADREDWRDMVVQGIRENWYHIRVGEVDHVEPTPDGKVRTVITGATDILQDRAELDADFILDCTGLISSIDQHPLLKDLVEHHGLGRNVQGRLDVADDFEIVGMRNAPRGSGRIYAAGVATLGGPYAPVDSFLGLQYAAQRSINAMVYARAPRLRHLGASRSFSQWMKWARHVTPEGRRVGAGPPPIRRQPVRA